MAVVEIDESVQVAAPRGRVVELADDVEIIPSSAPPRAPRALKRGVVPVATQIADAERQAAQARMSHAGERPLTPSMEFLAKRRFDPMAAGDRFAEAVSRIPLSPDFNPAAPRVGRFLPEGGVAKDVVRTIGSTVSTPFQTAESAIINVAPIPGLGVVGRALKDIGMERFPRLTKALTDPIMLSQATDWFRAQAARRQRAREGRAYTDDEILSVWNSPEFSREKNPRLYDYVAGLPQEEKVAIARRALGGKGPKTDRPTAAPASQPPARPSPLIEGQPPQGAATSKATSVPRPATVVEIPPEVPITAPGTGAASRITTEPPPPPPGGTKSVPAAKRATPKVTTGPGSSWAREHRKNAIILDYIARDLKEGMPPGKVFIEEPNAPGREVRGYSSTYPKYFRNKGYTAAEALNIIERIKAGKTITERQQGIIEDLISGKRDELLDMARSVRRERQTAQFPFGANAPGESAMPTTPPGKGQQAEMFRPEIPTAKIPAESTLKRGAEAGLFEEGGPNAGARAEAGARASQGEIFPGRAPSGTADTGGYAKSRPKPDPGPDDPQRLESPELVELAVELMKGRYPSIMRKLRGLGVRGRFYGEGAGNIKLSADIAKDPESAVKTLAHEIGHLIDYLPDRTLARGNILGRLASLKRYGKHLLEEYPGAPKGILTDKDRARIRREAEAQMERERAVKEGAGTLFEKPEVVTEGASAITPQEIVDVWKTIEAREKNPVLYDFIARLTPAEKVAIVKQALKGIVDPKIQARFKISSAEVKKPFIDWSARTKAIYEQLLREEIVRRKLYEVETITRELKDVSQRWKPFNVDANPSYTRYRYSSKELYADALSVLFNDPRFLREKARTFHKGLMAYLERKPEVKAAYEGIQERIKRGPAAVERARADRLRAGFRRYDDAMFRDVRESRDIMERIKYDVMDVNEGILRRVRQVPGGEGTIPPNANPRYALERLAHTASQAEGYLGDIKFKVIPILDRAALSWDDFNEYLFHRRVVGERAELFNPEGWTAETSARRLENWREQLGADRYRALKEAAAAFWRIRKDLIEKAIAARVFSQQIIAKLRANEEYATFSVVDYVEGIYGKGSFAKLFPQVGTLRTVGGPATATVVKDLSIMHAVNRAEAAHTTADFLQHHFPGDIKPSGTRWNGKTHMPVDTREVGMATMRYLRDGKIVGYDVPEYIAKSFTRDYAESEFIVRLLRGLAQPFREIFVNKQPLFWMFNIPRDYFRSAINLPGATATKLASYWLRGIKPAYRRAFAIPDEVIEGMLKNQELISVVNHQGLRQDDMHIERLLQAYRFQPQRFENAFTRPFMRFWEAIDRVGRAIDTIPKVAAHLYLREKFPKMDPQVRAHIVRSQVGTPDIIRRGYSTRWLNNLLLFSNPQIQGWRGDLEALEQRPAEVAWKRAKYNIIPKLLMFLAAAGYFGSKIEEMMDKVDPYDAANYNIYPIGLTPEGRVEYIRQPIDDVGRLLGGVLWKLFNWKESDQKLPGVVDYAAGQAPSLNPGPGLIMATMDYMAGRNPYDRFRGTEAIPEHIFKAHDFRTHKAFIQWLGSKSSGGWIKPPTGDDVEVTRPSRLEKLLGAPIVGTVVGKFIKTSQRGVDEQFRRALDRVRTEEARNRLDYRETLSKMVNGQPLDQKDLANIASREDFPVEVIQRYIGKRYGNPFLRAYAVAQSNTEKLAVLATYVEMEAKYVPRKNKPMEWEGKP